MNSISLGEIKIGISRYRYLTGFVFLVLAHASYGLEFEIQNIAIGHGQNIAFMPFVSEASGVPEMLVIETPDLDERDRQMQGLVEEPVRTVAIYSRSGSTWTLRLRKQLDASMDLVDVLQTPDGVRLVGYQDAQLHFLDEQTQSFEPMFSTSSMFVGRNWDSSPTMEMFADLNRDGFDDFLLPGFEGWQIAMQGADGFSSLQVIGPRPHMNFGDTARYVGYRAETPYLLDENRDGLNDLAFWLNGRFEVYLQDPSGKFAKDALILDPDLKDVLGGYFSISLGTRGDDEDDVQRLLDGVEDIDGDGMADLIIQSIQGEGIFGLETQYEIYRGMVGPDDHLRFEQNASSIVSTGGIQLNNERLDLTGDGVQEFVVTSVDITIGTIIGALITRSVSVDVSIYHMVDGVFPDKPSLKKEITVRFDFATGNLFIPAILNADVTGDGREDLLVQKGLDTLLVYPGQAGRKLFARSPIKLALSLPRDRDGFVVSDLDGDGRDELILYVERDEGSVLSVVAFSD